MKFLGSHVRFTRAESAAIAALRQFLKDRADKPHFKLTQLVVIANRAARPHTAKPALFPSVYDYEHLLPTGCRPFYSDHHLVIRNPFFHGEDPGARHRTSPPDTHDGRKTS